MPAKESSRSRVLLSVFLYIAAEQLGLSQRDVARLGGFSAQLLTDIKNGRRPMTAKMAKKIEVLFDVDWESIESSLSFEWRRLKPEELDDLLNIQLPLINHHLFPPIREPKAPEFAAATMTLPVLDRPTAGEPQDSEFFTGQFSTLPEPAMAMARRATQPYLLRRLNGDYARRFFPGDLLLLDQDIADLSSRILAVRRNNDYGLVRWDSVNEDDFHPVALNKRPALQGCIRNNEVVGVVKAVIWSRIKQVADYDEDEGQNS